MLVGWSLFFFSPEPQESQPGPTAAQDAPLHSTHTISGTRRPKGG